MIEGLKVTVSGAELKSLCEVRAGFHEERVKFYNEQRDALPEMDEDVPEFANVSKAPQQMMSDRIKAHKGEAEEMWFFSKHLVQEEQYLLGREDLARLGVVSSRY
jgi:hypothetical protein